MVPTGFQNSRIVGRLRWKTCNNAAVAQRIRASVYGTEGRGFESLQPHQLTLTLFSVPRLCEWGLDQMNVAITRTYGVYRKISFPAPW
jgi:hypothetical protein